MKKNKQNFFEQMKDYRIGSLYKQSKIAQTAIGVTAFIFLLAMEYLLLVEFPDKIVLNVIGFSFLLLCALYIWLIITIFKRNSLLFKTGEMSSGVKNYIISAVIVYLTMIILYFMYPNQEIKDLILAAFTPITTILAAVLAVMGVHYTLVNQQKEMANKNNLIFSLLDGVENCAKEIEIQGAKEQLKLNISLKNISTNQGFLVGIYRICGSSIYQVGDNLLYQPILANTSYKITNICYSVGDEELIIVYKDIGENYYYIYFRLNDEKGIKINRVDKCDFTFLQEVLEETQDAEEKVEQRSVGEEPQFDLEEINEFDIKIRKEETRPRKTRRVNGYDLIVDENGNILTNSNLLSLLKKERENIAKENKIRSYYIIFNNQQLVILATYPPKNRKEFISLFGLGEKKFELYGARILECINNFQSK